MIVAGIGPKKRKEKGGVAGITPNALPKKQ